MPNEVKLLPCAFCGSKRAIPERVLASEWLVMCDKCEATGPSGASKDKAIAAWNHRPTTVVTDEVVERVALIVGDKLGGHEGLGQVYRRNGDVRWKQSLEIARAALASMPTVVTGEQPGWLPIESAPSGKIVLAWCPKHQLVALERRDGKLTETWAISPSGRADCPEPTHWRPLPEPPAQPGDA